MKQRLQADEPLGIRRRWALGLIGVGAAALGVPPAVGRTSAGPASGALPPPPLFFDPPLLSAAKLSPDGRAVALRVGAADARARLAVLDLATRQPRVVAAFTDTDVLDFDWVNDRRLVFGTGDLEGTSSWFLARSFLQAVDADGGRLQRLGAREDLIRGTREITGRLTRWAWPLGQFGSRTGDEIYVVQSESADVRRLLRLNTVTGFAREVAAPLNAVDWFVDDQDELRAVISVRADEMHLHWREPGGAWRVLQTAPRYTGELPRPMHIDTAGRVQALARNGRDTQALWVLDPATGRLAESAVLAVEGFDLDAGFVSRDRQVLGLRLRVDALTTHWFDERLREEQAEVDRLLPGTTNLLDPPERGDSPWRVVKAYSDREPGRFFAYHAGRRELTPLGAARPAVEPARMGGMDLFRVRARDGLSIPCWLTLPAGATLDARPRLPMVVMVHGGPWVRGASWQWDAEVQFLASRGYAVLQPEFRGSLGFGDGLYRAGFRQWGQAMQHDLVDCARWAIDQGAADARRVAILGSSYGGYAALMGLIQEPSLFRCGVSHVGVTDLLLLHDAHWSDLTRDWRRFGLNELVGDRRQDEAMLREFSPLHQAERLRNPVLIAQGRLDLRVPVEHGRRMAAALRRHNPAAEYVEYEKDGHGWYERSSRLDYWQRVESFLGRHLG